MSEFEIVVRGMWFAMLMSFVMGGILGTAIGLHMRSK